MPLERMTFRQRMVVEIVRRMCGAAKTASNLPGNGGRLRADAVLRSDQTRTPYNYVVDPQSCENLQFLQVH